MPSQQAIDRFTLAFHHQALGKLRADPSQAGAALAVVQRWRAQRGPRPSDLYLSRWEQLLQAGVDVLELIVCSDSSEGATLRSMSPLGFMLSAQERQTLRRLAMVAPTLAGR